MPDAQAVAASRDIVQILFYFVCALGAGVALSLAWFAKYMLVPARDRHFVFIDHQMLFMDRMEKSSEERLQMHRDNLKRLSEIYRLTNEINGKIKCPAVALREVTHG